MKNKGITTLGFDDAAYARTIKRTVGVATSRAQNNGLQTAWYKQPTLRKTMQHLVHAHTNTH